MLHLRQELLSKLAAEKLGKAFSEELIRLWPPGLKAPSRFTIWRWLTGRTPIPSRKIIPLAAAFDLDPTALFECSADDFESLSLELQQDVGSPERSPLVEGLGWAYDFITPSYEWPPKQIARSHYNRSWRTFDFSHTAMGRKNFFQRILIKADERKHTQPQVWHFAFRIPNILHFAWRPYGVVIREGPAVQISHTGGKLKRDVIEPTAQAFPVETYFGPGPADFRIASLHPFRAEVMSHWNEKDRCLRFDMSGLDD